MKNYDLRNYHIVEGTIGTLGRVLRNATLPLLRDHGMRAVGFRSFDGRTLHQITLHGSVEAMPLNCKRLHAGPRWKASLAAVRQPRFAVKEVVTTPLHGIDGLPPEAASEGEA